MKWKILDTLCLTCRFSFGKIPISVFFFFLWEQPVTWTSSFASLMISPTVCQSQFRILVTSVRWLSVVMHLQYSGDFPKSRWVQGMISFFLPWHGVWPELPSPLRWGFSYVDWGDAILSFVSWAVFAFFISDNVTVLIVHLVSVRFVSLGTVNDNS